MDRKSLKAYNYILDQLDSGHWDEGSKVPGARKLAVAAGCGFPLMQTVIEILCQQGILVTKARSGTYVAENWRQRILACNVFIIQPGLKEIIIRKNSLPDDLRIARRFDSGMFELRVSHYLLSHHEEYHDLSEIFEELFPDKSDFFEKAIAPFYVEDKLCGIPFIFSPRFILCNRKIFEDASCPLPGNKWTWDEFVSTLGRLQNVFPDKKMLSIRNSIHHWSTILFRFGGQIYAPEDKDPIKIDYPESVKALQCFAEVLRNFKSVEFDREVHNLDDYAMLLTTRQNLYPYPENEINKNFHPVKLPLPSGGRDTNNQAVDLICVRKECSNLKPLKDFIKFMLSNRIQDFIGKTGYGLPIRRSSTSKLEYSNSPLTRLLYSEIENISTEYHIFSPELYRMISDGVNLSISKGSNQEIADSLHELGQAMRMFLKIEDFRKK